MQGNIFKIEKNALPDGQGLTTTIYFKGCPLRCSWCSGPRFKTPPKQILWDSRRCLFCGLCEAECPAGSLRFVSNKLVFSPDSCTGCRSCVQNCPPGTLRFAAMLMSLDEIMDVIGADAGSYGSRGGVILSGGDALLQPEFASALLKECHRRSIRTTVETTGFSKPLAFSRLAANTDLLIMDIKHYCEKKHVRYTGVSNQSILENLDFAVASGIPVAARLTIVPGINDTLYDAAQFGKLLAAHRVKDVILLTPKQFSNYKNGQLLISPCEQNGGAPSPFNAIQYIAALQGFGLNVRQAAGSEPLVLPDQSGSRSA